MVLLYLSDALLARDEPSRRLEYLALDHEGSFPILMLFTFEITSLWPHSLDVLKVVLEILDTVRFLLFLFFSHLF